MNNVSKLYELKWNRRLQYIMRNSTITARWKRCYKKSHFKMFVTDGMTLTFTQGHQKWHHPTGHVLLPTSGL